MPADGVGELGGEQRGIGAAVASVELQSITHVRETTPLRKAWTVEKTLTRQKAESLLVWVTWTEHSDALRPGGRVLMHSGPCERDSAHLVLWHWCGDAGRMVPSAHPTIDLRWECDSGPTLGKLSWPRCCGLSGEMTCGVFSLDD